MKVKIKMGCGSSSSRKTVNQAEELRNFALANHIYSILGIAPVSEDVAQYVMRLRSEGYDSPNDLDKLSIATLGAEPFFFKKGHLLRVEQSRKITETMEQGTLKEIDATGMHPTGRSTRADLANVGGHGAAVPARHRG